MEDLDTEAELNFGNVNYIFSVSAFRLSTFDPTMKLIIDCESTETGHTWRGDFQQKYIEEITSKAGNFKKFSIFTKMLSAALKNEQPNELILDLLTQQDLATLKARKQGGDLSSAPVADHSLVDPK